MANRKNITDQPLADKGLQSYRCYGRYGWTMIGANSDDEAFSEALRSSTTAQRENLQKWNGWAYVPCSYSPGQSQSSQSFQAPQAPLTLYHGSGTAIERFDYKFTNAGSDQLGSGFYFTNRLDDAERYAFRRRSPDEQKLGGEDAPNVLHVHLAITNPMGAVQTGPNLTEANIKALLNRSPCLNEALENFGDVSFEGAANVMNRAVAAYVSRPGTSRPLLRQLFDVANDFFPDQVAEFNKAVFEVLGYDGVVQTFDDGQVHYVAFFPEQIEIIATQQLHNADGQRDGEEIEGVEEVETKSVNSTSDAP